jgi:NAD(P)-dependent dehydrogenase (short-subunit alcohol dehydrogenase family)
MYIAVQVLVVTGAARGLGRELVDAVLARGATTVYPAARNPSAVRADHSLGTRLGLTPTRRGRSESILYGEMIAARSPAVT